MQIAGEYHVSNHLVCFLVPKPLVELHVKLLRKLGRSVSTDRWEKYLAKVSKDDLPKRSSHH